MNKILNKKGKTSLLFATCKVERISRPDLWSIY